ncbi:MAG: protein-(glutamine-N5) methyltransferase, release factor-specific, partial [Flavobacteriaceae bacterium]
PNVRDYEPHMALFAPQENPIYFYEQIAAYGKKALKSGGVLYFEINPLDREELMKMLLKNDYVHPEIRSDIFGNFRFLKAIKT